MQEIHTSITCFDYHIQFPPMQTSTYTVRCKIPHMEPSQLPLDFLQLLNNSLSKDPRHPCLIMNASMSEGCIELVLDVSLLDSSAAPVTTSPTPGHTNHVLHMTGMAGRIVQPISTVLDPTTWLQHLHMQPPRGVVATAQIGGRCVLCALVFLIRSSFPWSRMKQRPVCQDMFQPSYWQTCFQSCKPHKMVLALHMVRV